MRLTIRASRDSLAGDHKGVQSRIPHASQFILTRFGRQENSKRPKQLRP